MPGEHIRRIHGASNLVDWISGCPDPVSDAGYDDFELRSKDFAALNYFKGDLRVVQNLNVGRYMTVSKPGC